MKLFDNQRITVWEVTWKRSVAQTWHRHRYDMAGVYLRWGPVNVTALDGSVRRNPVPFQVPRLHFQVSGITHKEEASGTASDPEQLAIMIDLKEPATKARPASPAQSAFQKAGARNAMENERIRIWDQDW